MPDSRSIVHTIETPVYDLRRLPIDGSAPQMIVVSPRDKKAGSVSPDGRTVVYFESVNTNRLMFAPTGGGQPEVVGPSDNSQANASFSPDGRWLAYEETGPSDVMQVYVRPVGREGGQRQVSADGGSQPRFSKNGHEIVYRKGDAMMATSFDPQSGEVGPPAMLFRKPDAGQMGATDPTMGYDVTPDGSQFALVVPVERANIQPTVVVLNWLEELQAKVKQR